MRKFIFEVWENTTGDIIAKAYEIMPNTMSFVEIDRRDYPLSTNITERQILENREVDIFDNSTMYYCTYCEVVIAK